MVCRNPNEKKTNNTSQDRYQSRRKARNNAAKEKKSEILFDPSITCKEDITECFRVFTNPNEISRLPAQRFYTAGTNTRHREITIYTDGACTNNGKLNARCGSGVWFATDDERNKAIRIPGENQSNKLERSRPSSARPMQSQNSGPSANGKTEAGLE